MRKTPYRMTKNITHRLKKVYKENNEEDKTKNECLLNFYHQIIKGCTSIQAEPTDVNFGALILHSSCIQQRY